LIDNISTKIISLEQGVVIYGAVVLLLLSVVRFISFMNVHV